MNNNKYLKPSMLSLAIASVLGGSPLVASAEEAAKEKELEVIEVRGIRSSVIKAMDLKRDSNGVMDAISSEDIGKMPDTNLAESLQRISGVSIDRSNNEGNQVSVRGFGPNFNMVTFNGRQMPSASTSRDSVSINRAFNFAEIAPESVAGVQIFKTSKANVQSGGIGSTINIESARPLTLGQRVISGQVKGLIDTTTETGDDVTPEASAMFSNVFDLDGGGKFGVLVSGSYQERHNREEKMAIDGWLNSESSPAVKALEDNPNFSNPTNAPFWNAPQNYNIDLSDHERERVNASLVLQYAPSDKLEVTVDHMISTMKDSINRNQLGLWFTHAAGANEAVVDENGTLIQYGENGGTIDFFGYEDLIETENASTGINIKWQVNDALTLKFDAHSSESEAQPDKVANEKFIINGVYADFKNLDFGAGGDVPALDLGPQGRFWGDETTPGLFSVYGDYNSFCGCQDNSIDSLYDVKDIKSLFVINNLKYNKTTVDEQKIDGVWVNEGDGALNSISFGIANSEYETRMQWWTKNTSTGGYDPLSDANINEEAEALFNYVPIAGLLEGFSGTGSLPPGMYQYDTAQMIALIEGQIGLAPGETGAFGPENLDQDHVIKEETVAAYVQFDFETEFNNMPFNAVLGLRYETTDVTSDSLIKLDNGLLWQSGNELFRDSNADGEWLTAKSDYGVFLPSMDLSLEVQEDIIGRFSYSKSITRPDLTQMRNAISLGETKVGTLGASGGNAALRPYTSQNFDLALEWYYGEGSYASVNYFYKIVDNFITVGTVKGTIPNASGGVLTDPSTGEYFDRAVANVGEGQELRVIFQEAQRLYCEDEGIAECDSNVYIPAQADSADAIFDISTPENGPDAEVDGWEFAVQHIFGESGFGLQANATFVDGDVEFDNSNAERQFALVGLSDSANFVGFYDKDGIQFRVAYNWRDDFLAGIGQLRVPGEPTYTEAYGQIDINASYDINENFTVFMEGINVNDETIRQHGRASEQLTAAIQSGPRYVIGIRGKF